MKAKRWVVAAVLLAVLAYICYAFYSSSSSPTTETEERQAFPTRLAEARVELANRSLTHTPALSVVTPSREESVPPSLQTEKSSATTARTSRVDAYAASTAAVRLTAVDREATTSKVPAMNNGMSAREAKRTFIITHSFGGQLTRALKNMMVQQCWAKGLATGAATIVEPFSSKSLLLHTPAMWDSVEKGQVHNFARFSDYFDLKFYNHVSMERGGVPLIMWEEFLSQAPRQVVLVTTPLASCSNEHRQNMVDRNFQEFLRGLESLNFKVIKTVPIDCHDHDRGRKFIEVVRPYLKNSTLVFSSWRNYNVVRTWLDVQARCGVSDKAPGGRLRPSSKMEKHMNNYRTRVLAANKTVAIMLRVERFLTLKASTVRSTNETVDSCLAKTLSVFASLQQQPRWSESQPFLTLDIGRYGSGIMQKTKAVSKFNESLDLVTASVTDLLVKVYGGRWRSIEEWEASFPEATEGIEERGYVAMLQRNIAVSSDCLILMGGGSFQEVAATQYLQAHPDPAQQCLHVVCSATALTTSLEPPLGRHKPR